MFIKIGPDKEVFEMFEAINEIFRNIKQSPNELTKQTTKSMIDKISMQLIELEFKSDNMIK